MRRWTRIALSVLAAFGIGAAAYIALVHPRASMDVEQALLAVQRRPEDPNAWIALGDAQAAVDRGAAAEQAYRTAIGLLGGADPGDGRAQARLGFLLYGHGDDVEAERWLRVAVRLGAQVPLLEETLLQITIRRSRGGDRTDQGRADESGAEARRFDARGSGTYPSEAGSADAGVELDASVLAARPAPRPAQRRTAAAVRSPGGECVVPLVRQPSGALLVEADLNGVGMALLVDTGATITVLNRTAASLAGLRILEGRLRAQTANGPTEMSLGWVDDVVLGGRVLEGLRVAVCDECISVGDGLLGVDVQGTFDLQVDVAARQLLFADCP